MRPCHDVWCAGWDFLIAPRTPIGLLRLGRRDGSHDPHAVRLGFGLGMPRPKWACGSEVFAGATRHEGHGRRSGLRLGLRYRDGVRVLIARCQVDYAGKLTAHLPMAERLIMVKADGSISIHADGGAYKPLNWMTPPCTVTTVAPSPELLATLASEDVPLAEVWEVSNKDGDTLQIAIAEIVHDYQRELGSDPGLQKDGVEAHLQALLAEHPEVFGEDWRLVQREFYTPIGPVDLLFRDAGGALVAVEVKRRGEVDGVEQLTRYLELMNADPQMSPVRGIFAAQLIKPQAKVLASTRGIGCVAVDYDALRGMDDPEDRLF